jgi:fatty acid desaturase
MLRHREDLRTLATISFYWVLFATGWFLHPGGLWRAALVVACCVSTFLCAVAAHNVVHCPVFEPRWLNQAFQVWLSMSYGFPISEYIPGHNLSHHRFTQASEDVMRTTKVNFRWNWLNLLAFFFYVAPGVTLGNYRYRRVMHDRNRAWARQLDFEIAFVWGVKALLLLLDWKLAILYCFIPHLFAVWGITTINFVWHDGCDVNHPQNHSRNFLGPVFNWFTFNNGYHGMHHEVPGLHWSLLPENHRIHMVGIDPRLEQGNLWGYLFKTFVYPGKRVTYDGRPLHVEQLPDADWVGKLQTEG